MHSREMRQGKKEKWEAIRFWALFIFNFRKQFIKKNILYTEEWYKKKKLSFASYAANKYRETEHSVVF
jgi:hypothetical protein